MWKPHAVSNTQAVIVDKWTSITKIPEVEISSLLLFFWSSQYNLQFLKRQIASFEGLAFLVGSRLGSAAGLVPPNSASPFLFPLPFPFPDFGTFPWDVWPSQQPTIFPCSTPWTIVASIRQATSTESLKCFSKQFTMLLERPWHALQGRDL